MFAENGIAGQNRRGIGWALKSTEEREGETDDGFAIVTAVLMSVPDRQQGYG